MTADRGPGHPAWCRRDDVLWRNSSRGLVLLGPGSGAPFELVGPARAIWEALAAPVSVDDLVGRLAMQYQRTEPEVADVIEPLLADLVERGVLQQRDRP